MTPPENFQYQQELKWISNVIRKEKNKKIQNWYFTGFPLKIGNKSPSLLERSIRAIGLLMQFFPEKMFKIEYCFKNFKRKYLNLLDQ